MKKHIILSSLLSAALLFTVGCGSNSKSDPGTEIVDPGDVVVSVYSFLNLADTISVEGETVIRFQLVKDGAIVPGAQVSVKPFNLDIGTIDSYSVTTDANGFATFTFTPAVGHPDTAQLTFSFVEGDIVLEQIVNLTFVDNTGTDPIVEESGYSFNNVDTNITITSLDVQKISFQLVENDIVVPDAAVFLKSFSSDIGTVDKYTSITDANGIGSFFLTPSINHPETATLTLVYMNGDILLQQNITLNFDIAPVTNEESVPTSLSLVYESTTCTDGKFVNKYHVHAVDSASNLPKKDISVDISLVNGVKVNHYDSASYSGSLVSAGSQFTFVDTVNDLSPLAVNDNIIIFPSVDRTDASYLGGWKVTNLIDGDSVEVDGNYTNVLDTDSLSYVAGNENRLLDRDIVIAHVDKLLTNTDENGFAYFDVVFDPLLAGHTVAIETHGDDNGHRVGISKKIGLRWGSYFGEEITFANTGNPQHISMGLSIGLCNGEGSEPLKEVNIVPSSFIVEPIKHCSLNVAASDFYTGSESSVNLVINTSGIPADAQGTDECTVKWNGSNAAIYYEY